MRVLLTGYGKLGKVLAKKIAKKHEVVIFDAVPVKREFKSFMGNISSYDDVYKAMEGIDAVIHTAAQQDPRMDTEAFNSFMANNVIGTHNILQSALMRGIKKLVLSSSIVVCGNLMRSAFGMQEDPSRSARYDENVALRPQCIYDLTKVLNEQEAEFFARTQDMNIICLRYCGFSPEQETSGEMFAKGVLSWLVHTEDVVQANELAVESDKTGFNIYVVGPKKRLKDSDNEALVQDPGSVIKRLYPQEYEILKQKGIEMDPIFAWWDSSKAQKEIGFNPQHNFEEEVRRL
jgi:UDP-glucose 4-epimerase